MAHTSRPLRCVRINLLPTRRAITRTTATPGPRGLPPRYHSCLHLYIYSEGDAREKNRIQKSGVRSQEALGNDEFRMVNDGWEKTEVRRQKSEVRRQKNRGEKAGTRGWGPGSTHWAIDPAGHRSIGPAGHRANGPSIMDLLSYFLTTPPSATRPVGLVGLVRQIFYQIEIHGFICQKSSLCLRIVSHSDTLGRNYPVTRLCT